MNAKIMLIGLVAYAVLGLLALHFFVERTAFVDIAFHLFCLVKDGDFAIQNHRFVAGFTQVFPLLGKKAGLGLEHLMRLYSLGFVVFYLGVFIALAKLFKSWQGALAMLLFSTLMVSHTFYWIQSELPQGVAITILYFGFLGFVSERAGIEGRWWFLAVSAVFQIFIVFAHPLIIFPFAFLIAYFCLHQPAHRKLYLSALASFLALLAVKSLFFRTAYDSSSMGSLRNFIKLFPDYFRLESNAQFIDYAIKDYYLLIIGFIAAIAFYIVRKERAKMALTAAAFGGYLLLVNVAYPQGGEQFYMENFYLPLAVFVIYPLAFDLSRAVSGRTVLIVLGIVLCIRFADMYAAHRPYSARVAYLQDSLEKTENLYQKKLIVHTDHFSKDTLLMTWAVAYEFWLLSTIETGETRSIMIEDHPNEWEWVRTYDYNKHFATPWGNFEYSELPPKYFSLTDTSDYMIIY